MSEKEKLPLEEAERDKSQYHYKLFSSRETNFLFKHFKSMNKNADIPEVLGFGTVEAKTMQQKANLSSLSTHSHVKSQEGKQVK